MRKGSTVCLRATDPRGVTVGAIGKVLAIRKLPKDPEMQALVKWRGKSGPVAHDSSVLEVLEP